MPASAKSSIPLSTIALKSQIRASIGPALFKVAYPDSRFHFDFSSFITDFRGSDTATRLLRSHPAYKSARTIFITPDNCLEELRLAALNDNKLVLVTTYGIRRGFCLLDPTVITGEVNRLKASILDTMEKIGRHVTLTEIQSSGLKLDMLVTGTGAIDMRTGLRFGKGHGFFDLEWAMLRTINAISPAAKVVAVCHECQVVDVHDHTNGAKSSLESEPFDTICDLIFTSERAIEVLHPSEKPSCGVVWERLQNTMMEDIPPLGELFLMQEGGARF